MWKLFILLLLVIALFLFVIISMSSEPKFYYLNTNSTYATKTGYYNPSDLGYEEMRMLRNEKEKLFTKIKKLVNAPRNARVIYNSGATESIATCINWAKKYNKYGYIYGTKFDHPSVQKNCENMDMEYTTTETNNLAGVFLTHASSKTGELLDDSKLYFARQLCDIASAKSDFDIDTSKVITAYRPLIFLDVTQSITKIPIDMEKIGANALFFSLHKIGGPMNSGIMIISEPSDKPFVPLIAGEQNSGMRGGTLNETELVKSGYIFKMGPSIDSRKRKWTEEFNRLKKAGVDVYEPKGDHLYNTFLIKSKKHICPMIIVNQLAKQNIHVGTASACKNESEYMNGGMTGGAIDEPTQIRVSFMNENDIDDDAIDGIIRVLNEIEKS